MEEAKEEISDTKKILRTMFLGLLLIIIIKTSDAVFYAIKIFFNTINPGSGEFLAFSLYISSLITIGLYIISHFPWIINLRLTKGVILDELSIEMLKKYLASLKP